MSARFLLGGATKYLLIFYFAKIFQPKYRIFNDTVLLYVLLDFVQLNYDHKIGYSTHKIMEGGNFYCFQLNIVLDT